MCVDKVTFEMYSATQDTRVVENQRILRDLVLFQILSLLVNTSTFVKQMRYYGKHVTYDLLQVYTFKI